MKTIMKNISINSHNLEDKNFSDESLEIPEVKTYFGKSSIKIGYLLILAGGLGIILPKLFSFGPMLIIAGLVVIGSFSWIVHANKYKLYGKTEWLKPLILLTTGSLMLFYPLNTLSVVSLLLVTYLLFDAIGSFVFAYILRALAGAELMIFNGLMSIILAILFIFSWPESTLSIAALFIAISLILDGSALLYMSLEQRKLATKNS